jgi:hypothetical protein
LLLKASLAGILETGIDADLLMLEDDNGLPPSSLLRRLSDSSNQVGSLTGFGDLGGETETFEEVDDGEFGVKYEGR